MGNSDLCSADMETPITKPLEHPDNVETPDSCSKSKHQNGDAAQLAVHTSKKRIFRNMLFLNIPYVLFFSAFWSLANLQSTMNAEEGIGPSSQAVIYLCSMLSCFIPELLIGKYGCKATYALAIFLSCFFVAANFRLRWDVMMITSVLYGLSSGPLNTAMTLYTDEMAVRCVALTGMSSENVKSSFFGFCLVFQQLTLVIGNLMSFYILERGKQPLSPSNDSLYGECGVRFQQSSNLNNTNLDPPSSYERIVLTGAFLAMTVMAAVVALFLDPLKNDLKPVIGCSSVWQKIGSAVRHLKNLDQLLLLPITIFNGMEAMFCLNDYSQAFIACTWGVYHVGFVTICFGVCGILMSILVGPLVKLTSQLTVIVLASLISVAIYSIFFVWDPSPDFPVLLFVFSGLFGINDSIRWSQLPALYGLMFPNNREAAFSNFFFWSFFGLFLGYSYANYLSVVSKIIVLLTFLIPATLLFLIGQVKIKRAARTSASSAAGVE